MAWTYILWLGLLVLFLVVEAQTVSVVSIWFAVGSLCAVLAAFLGAPLWLQAVIFLVVSAVLLAALRPLVRKHFTPKLEKTNVESIPGSTGLVTSDIDNTRSEGQVKIGAMEWTARSTSGAPIKKDTLVRVDRIEGVKAFVSPAEVPAGR